MTSNFQETNPDEEEKARPSTDATDKMFCPEVNPNNGVVDNDVIDGDEGKHITAIPNLPTSSSCSISAAAAAGGNPSLPAAAAAASLPPPAEHDDTDASSMRGNYESWNDMLYQLLLFKARNGDVNVPDNDTRYRPLYDWVQTQREHYTLYQQDETSTALLNADRVAVLESIDIQCTVRGEMLWQTYFDALVAYKNEHDDVRVPRHYEKVPKLSEWVTDQRRQCKLRLEGKPSTMTAERMAKLDQLGFVWQFRDRMDWNERYEKLLEYKKEVSLIRRGYMHVDVDHIMKSFHSPLIYF
jgi:hypothetical protein